MFTVDAAPDESQGAIWMGGAAPVVDSAATSGSARQRLGQLVQPCLRRQRLDTPAVAVAQARAVLRARHLGREQLQDLDMSVAPALLPDGQVILTGKSRIVYLLNQADLGGIGGQQAALGSACNQDIDGGVAMQGTTVYLPCTSGIVAVRAVKSPAALHLLWSSGTAAAPPSWPRAWSGPSGRTERSTGWIRPPGRYGSRPRSACPPTTSPARARPTACCWLPRRIRWSPSAPPRTPRPPALPRAPKESRRPASPSAWSAAWW